MTEAQAKNKWCPFAKTAGEINRMYARGEGTYPVNQCVASACMMWRRVEITYTENISPERFQELNKDADGYCGLAGKP